MDSRTPPPQGAPPSYAFVARVYRRSLRPVVIATAVLAGLWTLFSAIGFFRSFGVDRTQNVPKIAALTVALGALYMAVAVFMAFGVFSAATQRIRLVRIYAFLAALSTLIVFGTSLTRVVVHFTWKNDIIRECTNLTKDKEVVYFGFWGPIYHDVINEQEAADWCRRSWDHNSWSEIVAMLILAVLGLLFTAVAFSYYRQLLDPTSPANASRAPSSAIRTSGGAFPTHYNPPYNASLPTLSYGAPPPPGAPYGSYGQYAPPAGPPPGHDDPFDSKPPGYSGGRLGYDGDDKDKDPFADYTRRSTADEERDVTSRPGPGGRDTFR